MNYWNMEWLFFPLPSCFCNKNDYAYSKGVTHYGLNSPWPGARLDLPASGFTAPTTSAGCHSSHILQDTSALREQGLEWAHIHSFGIGALVFFLHCFEWIALTVIYCLPALKAAVGPGLQVCFLLLSLHGLSQFPFVVP